MILRGNILQVLRKNKESNAALLACLLKAWMAYVSLQFAQCIKYLDRILKWFFSLKSIKYNVRKPLLSCTRCTLILIGSPHFWGLKGCNLPNWNFQDILLYAQSFRKITKCRLITERFSFSSNLQKSDKSLLSPVI